MSPTPDGSSRKFPEKFHCLRYEPAPPNGGWVLLFHLPHSPHGAREIEGVRRPLPAAPHWWRSPLKGVHFSLALMRVLEALVGSRWALYLTWSAVGFEHLMGRNCCILVEFDARPRPTLAYTSSRTVDIYGVFPQRRCGRDGN